MPPKKDGPAPDSGITGYDLKETKLFAAAFLSSTGPDKYDWSLFASLSGYTEGTLKKFWPAVKNKGIENHENFRKFLAGPTATTSKATGSKKRKADTDAKVELEPKTSSADTTDSKPADGKPKKAPAKGKGRGKKVKVEDAEEDSAAGGDGMET